MHRSVKCMYRIQILVEAEKRHTWKRRLLLEVQEKGMKVKGNMIPAEMRCDKMISAS